MVTKKSQYLESKVLTAPSHRLHLMLIEGAIRFGQQAEGALSHGDRLAADVPLLRMLDIVGELLASVRASKTELNRKIAEVYLFLFRTVAEAKVHGDLEKLHDAMRLLELEQETWQLVCSKLSSEAAPRKPIPAPLGNLPVPPAASGISLEA